MRIAALSVSVLATCTAVAGGLNTKSKKKSADPCTCLNWKEAYGTGLVQCGQGYEVTDLKYNGHSYDPNGYLHNKTEHLHGTNPQVKGFCDRFYVNYDDNKCVHMSMAVGPKRWWGQHWCYTSVDCSVKVPILNVRMSHQVVNRTMSVPNANVRIKVCEAAVDSRLADLAPAELMAYSQTKNMTDVDLMLKLAYDTERKMYYKDLHNPKHKNFYDNLKINETEPLVFEEDANLKSKIIVHKKKLQNCLTPQCANDGTRAQWRVFRAIKPVGQWGFQCIEGCW